MHRGATRTLGNRFTGPSVHAGTRSLAPVAILHRASGQMRGCAQIRSWGGSLHTWRGPTSRTCRCPKKMQRAGSTLGARVWIMPAPTVVIPTSQVDRQAWCPDQTAVEGGAGRSGLCCCGQERRWSSKRPVQASARPRGHLQGCLLFLVTSPRRVILRLVLLSG